MEAEVQLRSAVCAEQNLPVLGIPIAELPG